jgi:demethylmenaquinone methyltransferase / 2-methoxy-6-polyprenyl-1,4-benzoquinol methylase
LDINESMLKVGKERAQNQGYLKDIDFVHANAEELPFENETFDAYTISFGIRNVPRIEKALSEAYRVLKKGGRIMIMEFSKVNNTPLNYIYQFYNFNVVPAIG